MSDSNEATHYMDYAGQRFESCDLRKATVIVDAYRTHNTIRTHKEGGRTAFAGIEVEEHPSLISIYRPILGAIEGRSTDIIGVVKASFPHEAEEILMGAAQFLFAKGMDAISKYDYANGDGLVALSCRFANQAGLPLTSEQESVMGNRKITLLGCDTKPPSTDGLFRQVTMRRDAQVRAGVDPTW